MDRGRPGGLIRVKGSPLRHPAAIAAGTTALVALLALNVTAFVGGMRAPWLLAGVIIADMLVIGAGAIVAARPLHSAALPRRAPRAYRALRQDRRHQPPHGRRDDAMGAARRRRGIPD